ncbi:uncharacterized protein LOC117152513 [Bombus impatiens]|uniref:Uncharacterized protein LOC117152513 n=1 Tax=Bombus impatiens TaxID=132113 RepID=A0A6P8LEM3_BOMIM|nr:uncharacterized protein LOC117152513 [Bombus impatiens]
MELARPLGARQASTRSKQFDKETLAVTVILFSTGQKTATLSGLPFAEKPNEQGKAKARNRRKERDKRRKNGLVFIVRLPKAAILPLHCHRVVTEIKEKHTFAVSIAFL